MGAVSVRVRDERSPGRAVGELELTLERRTTLRDLIRTRVREEVARYNAEPGERFNGLVRPTEAEEDANGYRLRKPRRLDWERQAQVAEEAFGRNGYFVLVGDRQVDDLDEELELTPETEIRFLRLTPLVGG
jgi:uncharacterized protein RhaS with RHS repeats